MNASVFSAVFLLLSFASSAVYAAPADEAPDPPDVPKLNTQPWVPARYRAVRENLLGKECGILFVGDSITECWEREGAALWKRLFLPMKAVNFGVSGDRTDSMLWRMEDTKLAVKTSPRYCVLLAGTNNIGRGADGEGHPGDSRTPVEEVSGDPFDPDGGDSLRLRSRQPVAQEAGGD